MLVKLMHTISSALQDPVIVVLIALTVLVVALLGMLIAEFFTERRYFRLSLPALIDSLSATDDAKTAINESALLWRQKKRLLELLDHPQASDASRESLAVNIVAQEQALYDKRVKVTDLIAKVSPMFGLMGTLIPLGPGIVAAASLLISTIRKSWYVQYMAAFEAACECVLERANEEASSASGVSSASSALPASSVPSAVVGCGLHHENAGEHHA